MKTPWEIKRSLFCCSEGECHKCYYENECDAVRGRIMCNALLEDNMAYIQQLEKERDAAVRDIQNAKWLLCHVCKNYYRPDPDVRHYECKALGNFSIFLAPSDFCEEDNNPISACGKFEWRGVCEENSKEGT